MRSRVYFASYFNIDLMQFFVKMKAVMQQMRWYLWYKGFLVMSVLLWVPHMWQQYFVLTLAGAMAFNLTSSIVYIFNDIKDITYDKRHPIKKYRPLAAGNISYTEAYSLMLLLAGVVLIVLGLIGVPEFSLLLLLYAMLNYMYSNWIKHVAYMDALLVGIFGALRVVGGFLLLQLPIAWYFSSLIFTFFMFFTLLFRDAELRFVTSPEKSTRPALRGYSLQTVRFLMTLLLMSSVILYFLSTSIILTELVYTDILYFGLLFSSYGYMIDGRGSKEHSSDSVSVILQNKQALVLGTLLLLVVATLLVWFR